MEKTIIVKIVSGNFLDGFTLVFQAMEDGINPLIQTLLTQSICRLDPCEDIVKQYKRWQKAYNSQLTSSRKLEKLVDQTKYNYINDVLELEQEIDKTLNLWLGESNIELTNVLQQLRKALNLPQPGRVESKDEYIRVIIETDNFQLRQLPWHLWNFFRDIHAAITIGSLNYQKPRVSNTIIPWISTVSDVINVLVILGDDSNINIKNDEKFLKHFEECNVDKIYIEVLSAPTSVEKIMGRLTADGTCWDILYFAGHSDSSEDGDNGLIYINSDDTDGVIYTNSEIEIKNSNIRKALDKAVSRGLQLAIFNSCNGLGLAHDLEELNIPHVIVMREAIPDYIAHKFLNYFFKFFSEGYSFCISVEKARQDLEFLKDIFPCASWLPVICHNPVTESVSWQNLLDSKSKPVSSKVYSKKNVLLLIIYGISISLATVFSDVLYQFQLQKKQDSLVLLKQSEYSYTCEKKEEIPIIFQTKVGEKKEFIRFLNDRFGKNAGYTPVRRCEEITSRLNLLGNYQNLQFKTGKINNQPVIFYTSQEGNKSIISLLLTVKPEDDAELVLEDLLNSKNSSNQPLID